MNRKWRFFDLLGRRELFFGLEGNNRDAIRNCSLTSRSNDATVGLILVLVELYRSKIVLLLGEEDIDSDFDSIPEPKVFYLRQRYDRPPSRR